MTNSRKLNRRAGIERRQREEALKLGQTDRRLKPERRLPEVSHVDFDEHVSIHSLDEWPEDEPPA